MIHSIIKRDGRVVLYEQNKIAAAILKAMEVSGEGNAADAARVANDVQLELENRFNTDAPHIEMIQDATLYGTDKEDAAKAIELVKALTADDVVITVNEPIIDGTPAYTNILDVYPIQYNQRWSASSNGYVECAGMICIAVPLADVVNKTIRMKGFEKDATASGKGASWYIYNGTTKIGTCNASDGSGVVWKSQDLVTDTNGVSSIPINATTFGSVTNGTTLYISLAVGDWVTVSSADLLGKIITIDQEIV